MSKTATKSTSMNLRLDTATRRQLQVFADDLGMPATALVTATIKQMLRSGEVRFTTSLEPTPYLEKLLREADDDIKHGRTSGPFDSVDAMFEALETAD